MGFNVREDCKHYRSEYTRPTYCCTVRVTGKHYLQLLQCLFTAHCFVCCCLTALPLKHTLYSYWIYVVRVLMVFPQTITCAIKLEKNVLFFIFIFFSTHFSDSDVQLMYLQGPNTPSASASQVLPEPVSITPRSARVISILDDAVTEAERFASQIEIVRSRIYVTTASASVACEK